MYKTVVINTDKTEKEGFFKNTTGNLTIDSDKLAHDIEKQCNKLNDEGYDVISINTITSSAGVAHITTYTSSIIVVGKKYN